MTKASNYYLTDSSFQLELNLHNIRRELILMIEDFEKQDCDVCLQLKCRCLLKLEKKTDMDQAYVNENLNDKDISKDAPSAGSLPQPKFEKEAVQDEVASETKINKDLEGWFETSRKAQLRERAKATDALLATLKNNCNSNRVCDLNDKVILEHRYASTANAVEAFFKSYKVQPINMTPANIAYITNKLTAAYVKQKAKKSEYTYF